MFAVVASEAGEQFVLPRANQRKDERYTYGNQQLLFILTKGVTRYWYLQQFHFLVSNLDSTRPYILLSTRRVILVTIKESDGG